MVWEVGWVIREWEEEVAEEGEAEGTSRCRPFVSTVFAGWPYSE